MSNSLSSLAFKDLLTSSMLIVTLMPIIIIFGIIILLSSLLGENIFSYLYSEFISLFNLDLNSNIILEFLSKFDFIISIFNFFF